MPTLALTRHATLRAQQRGVTHAMLDALIHNADVEAPVGGGCTVLRLSRERLMDRALRVSLGPMADRLETLAVVLADDHGGREGRRYRR